ncbi:type II secretion system protein [Candidatus Parcubacteria bacterium]|nr:type II secretion system protein [Candidatus Parcubacteria bacterium]
MKSFTQQGFTLVETLVSITILLIIVTGPLTISMTSAKSTSFASEQVVAFFLAQEGAEIAQKVRDGYLLEDINHANDQWDEFTDETSGDIEDCFSSTGCGLELNTDADGSLKTVIDCVTSTTKCKLYYNNTAERDRYTYSSSGTVEIPYTRKIYLTNISPSEVKVVSEVTWRTGNLRQTQKAEVETHLFNIYEN